jgi:hypothetical protein
MNDLGNNNVVGISFSQLFGEDSANLSMEKVEAFLQQAVKFTSEKAKVNPNQLVRIVHGKKVMWMTQVQASEYLKTEASDSQMQKDIERALRGGLKYLRQELEILLALAISTFTQFKEAEAINQKDIERIEPSLKRRQQEINEGISETSECEAILEAKRRKNPLLDEYEEMMGHFITAKTNGDMQTAMQLAKGLAEKKKYYLLLARGIEPDIRTIYYHRLNLQKTKKRILNTQGELCNSRQDALQLEISELQQNLNSVQAQGNLAAEDGLDAASMTLGKLSQYDLENVKKELTEKSTELLSLKTESGIIQKQESECEAVIEHIQSDVLQETDTKVNMKDVMSTQRKAVQPQHQSSVAKKKTGSGMHLRRGR